jgi:acetolactate synthase-1/2/3 large subunit
MHIFDALHNEPELSLITTRHEQTTTFMADGYARISGKVPAALVVPGPGVLNAGAGLATAYANSSPMLLVAGQVPSTDIGRDVGALHDIHDQLDIVRTMTKWSGRVVRVEEIPEAVHEAVRHIKTGRPRPVEVEIPPDVLANTADVTLAEAEEYPRAGASQTDVARAADLLAAAARPLILAGGGILRSGATQEVTALAEALNAVVITTAGGKGAIDERHPLSAGVSSFGWGTGRDLLPRADVVLAVGTRLAPPQQVVPGQVVINVNADPGEIGKTRPVDLGIEADAQQALEQMAMALRGKETKGEWGPADAGGAREASERRMRTAAGTQLAFMQGLRAAVPEETIIVSGVTTMAQWTGPAFPIPGPGRYVTHGYMGSLGYGFPTSLGAKVGAPDRPVVALSGDGGFLFGATELATAVQFGINTVTVVFRDNAFGSSKFDQQDRFGGRIVGTELRNPDFVALAEAFGARGVRVGGLDDAPAAVASAISANDVPTVIEVPIETIAPPYGLTPPSDA